jgi:thymidine phosphorylase
LDEPDALVREALAAGRAYDKFCEMIHAQGGNVSAFESMQLQSPREILAKQSGYIASMDVVRLGNAGRALSAEDPCGGLQVAVRIGDYVEAGAPLLRAYGPGAHAAQPLAAAFVLSDQPVQAPALVYDALCNAVVQPLERLKAG